MIWPFRDYPRCKITGNRIDWCNCLLHKEKYNFLDIDDISETIEDFEALLLRLTDMGQDK